MGGGLLSSLMPGKHVSFAKLKILKIAGPNLPQYISRLAHALDIMQIYWFSLLRFGCIHHCLVQWSKNSCQTNKRIRKGKQHSDK